MSIVICPPVLGRSLVKKILSAAAWECVTAVVVGLILAIAYCEGCLSSSAQPLAFFDCHWLSSNYKLLAALVTELGVPETCP